MKAILRILANIPIVLLLNQCTSAFTVTKNGSVLGPTSFLGEQHIESLTLDGPGGVHVAITGYDTHNPDRELTKALKTAYLTNQTVGLAKTGLTKFYDNKNITSKAQGEALLKGTKDPNVIPQNPNVIPVNPNAAAQ